LFLTAVIEDDQAIVSYEVGMDDLYMPLRTLLRDMRSTLGSAAWTRALLEMGPSRASVLRRRYKLY